VHTDAEVVDADEVIEKASEEARRQASEVVEQQLEISQHIGPLPSPDTLAQYDDRFPGLGQQIVAWTDSEIRHRQRIESEVVRAGISRGRAGQVIGALIVALAFVAIFTGHSIAGLIALAPVIAAFVGAQLWPALRPGPGEASDRPPAPDDDES
jgi:uncharacterized membrane protein